MKSLKIDSEDLTDVGMASSTLFSQERGKGSGSGDSTSRAINTTHLLHRNKNMYTLNEMQIKTKSEDWWLAPSASVVGNVSLGHDVSIWFNVTVRGDTEAIVIGDRSQVQDGSVLHADEGSPLIIEDEVSVGHMACLHGCTIGEGSLIGIGSIILNR